MDLRENISDNIGRSLEGGLVDEKGHQIKILFDTWVPFF